MAVSPVQADRDQETLHRGLRPAQLHGQQRVSQARRKFQLRQIEQAPVQKGSDPAELFPVGNDVGREIQPSLVRQAPLPGLLQQQILHCSSSARAAGFLFF